jgi:Disulphide bond corrector protein DsbC
VARRHSSSTRAWMAVAVLWACCACARVAHAQDAVKPASVVTWTLEAPATASPSTPFTAMLRAVVKPGWKFYAMTQSAEGPRPLRVRSADAAFTIDDPITPNPPPKTVTDTIWSARVSYHERTTAFALPVRAARATRGEATLRVAVRFQACSDELCLRPTEMTLERHVTVR